MHNGELLPCVDGNLEVGGGTFSSRVSSDVGTMNTLDSNNLRLRSNGASLDEKDWFRSSRSEHNDWLLWANGSSSDDDDWLRSGRSG